MSPVRSLQPADRESFRALLAFAFRNPFDKKSLELAYSVAGGKFPAGEPLASKVFAKISEHLEKVKVAGELNWQDFSGEDQELIKIAILHDAYDRCFHKFDDLILKQITIKETSGPVHFANQTLTLLRKRGFDQKESLRYFSFYYQLRRAWYFINHGLIGQSESMQTLRAHLWRSVFTSFPQWYERYLWNRMEDFSTFLIGETGTGKGTAAAAIGRSGYIPFDEKKNRFVESFTDNFIEINLSQFPESLIESELFGHRKGAFTGAVDNHIGIFERCSQHGSIFLDEIGDVSVPIQIKLLKVLEERSFSAVGGHDKLSFQGRIVTATNRSLEQLEKQQIFREDFYYRLCSNVIVVPSLRRQLNEDPATLEALLGHTIVRIVGKPVPELMQTILHILEKEVGSDYSWPGNVRELEQAVRSILLTLHYEGRAGELNKEKPEELAQAFKMESFTAHELISAYCSMLYKRYGTYEQVSQITDLDPRTVKKYVNKPSS